MHSKCHFKNDVFPELNIECCLSTNLSTQIIWKIKISLIIKLTFIRTTPMKRMRYDTIRLNVILQIFLTSRYNVFEEIKGKI